MTMHFKAGGDAIYLVGAGALGQARIRPARTSGRSLWLRVVKGMEAGRTPPTRSGGRTHRGRNPIHELIADGLGVNAVQ